MIQIRKAQETDAEAIAGLEEEAFPTECWNANTVKNELVRGAGFVAESKDGFLGYAIVRLDEDLADITRVAVAVRARRQGVARHLLNRILEWTASDAILCVEFGNTPALALYRSLGFSPIAMREGRAILERSLR